MIPFNRTATVADELHYVEQALQSRFVHGNGPFTRRATALLAAHFRGSAVLLTTSGTHALELAALLLDVAPGDEVILPSYTFSSTANAFALRGARLRFADVDPGTFSMELPQLESALGPRTRIVVAMPYGGVSRDLARIEALCAERNIALVIDNAHGLFATLHGRPLGCHGALSASSFHGTKNISCGEGGALVVNAPDHLGRAEILREKGTDRAQFLRGEVDKYTWRGFGSSYVLSDLLAAVLTAQLEQAEQLQRSRHATWALYRSLLEPVSGDVGLQLQHVPAEAEHPAHVFALCAPTDIDRARLLAVMNQRGVQAVTHYEPLHRAPAHDGDEDLPATDGLAEHLLRLPLYAELSEADAGRVVDVLVSSILELRAH